MTSETYSMSTVGAMRRIRTPHPHDVLCGRGGGINAHPGNQVFRDWVRDRKEDYNLAPNKMEKTRVATEVMDQVRNQNPPGRFLQKDHAAVSGPVWWVEVDEARALAKTSQALREGAPQIRLAHKEELVERAENAKKSGAKRKRKTTGNVRNQQAKTAISSLTNSTQPGYVPGTTTTPQTSPIMNGVIPSTIVTPKPMTRLPADEYNRAMENLQANVRQAKSLADEKQKRQQEQQQAQQQQQSLMPSPSKNVQIVPPLTSNKYFQQKYYNPINGNKRSRVDHGDIMGATPPLAAAPAPYGDNIIPLRLDAPARKELNRSGSSSSSNNKNKNGKGLPRMNSLALSDFSLSDANNLDEDGEFVNPFEDESSIINRTPSTSFSDLNRGKDSKNALRNLSSSNDDSNMQPPQSYPLTTGWDDTHHQSNDYDYSDMPDVVLDENHNHYDFFTYGDSSWQDSDFGEGMKSILDVVHPDLTSPEKGETIPTLLMPWRGNKNSNNNNGNSNNNGDNDGCILISQSKNINRKSPLRRQNSTGTSTPRNNNNNNNNNMALTTGKQ